MQVGASDESNRDDVERRPIFDFSAVGCGTLSNMDNKGHQLGGFTLQEWKSPLASSISSLSTKRRQIVGGSVSQFKSPGFVTPTEKQASFVRNEDAIHGASASSIQKSISKLELLAGSPFSSALSAKIDSSNLRSLHYLPRTPLDTVSEKNGEGTHVKRVDDDGTGAPLNSFSDAQSLSAVQKKVEIGNANNMDDSKSETPKDIRYTRRTEELRSPLKTGRSPYDVSTGILSAGQPSKKSASVTSPSQFTWPGKKRQPYLLTLEDPSQVRLVTAGTDSSLMGITLECMEGNKAISTPHKFATSVEARLEMESSTSPDYQDSQSRELRQHAQCNESVNYSSGQDAAPRGNVVNGSLLATTADRLDSFYMQSRVQSSSPIIDINHFKGLTEVENMDDGEVNLLGHRDNLGTMRNSPTPLRHSESHSFQSRTPDRNSQTEREQASLRNVLAEGGGRAASCSSTSPFARKSSDDLSIRKVCCFISPLNFCNHVNLQSAYNICTSNSLQDFTPQLELHV